MSAVLAVWSLELWSRPAALWLLALPLLVLLTARRARSARREATGTLRLWRAAADATPPRGGRSARRWPPGLLLLCAALCAGVLALAGPRTGSRAPRLHRYILDRSPSMFLSIEPDPARPGAAAGAAGAQTRMARGLAAARVQLAAAVRPGDEVRWATWDGAGLVEVEGRSPPEAWLLAPDAPAEEPPWERFDLAGTTWVTDAAPVRSAEPVRLRAALVASGGPAVPGAVSFHAGVETVWDGSGLREREVAEARVVSLGAGLPEALTQLVHLWGAARGLELTAEAGAARLRVEGPAAPLAGRVEGERDGWLGRGAVGALETPVAGARALARPRTWLAAGDGRALVRWRPGRVEVAWGEPFEIEGEPAAFAVSWSRLLDRALPPPANVVAFAERQAAGPQRLEPARIRPAGAGEPRDGRRPWAPLLAGLAALLALGALGCEA